MRSYTYQVTWPDGARLIVRLDPAAWATNFVPAHYEGAVERLPRRPLTSCDGLMRWELDALARQTGGTLTIKEQGTWDRRFPDLPPEER